MRPTVTPTLHGDRTIPPALPAESIVQSEIDLAVREEPVLTREAAALLREEATTQREEAARLREEAAELRETIVRTHLDAEAARTELNQYVVQLRDANQQLVLAALRGQTLTENAEEANRLKDEFLATVSHELRTPLTAIIGWARMLRLQQVGPDRMAHALEVVDRNAAHLTHLIEDLLDVSRISTGSLHLAEEEVDLVSVAEGAIDTMAHLATEKAIQIYLRAEAKPTDTVIGDPGRLRQVVWNLLSNAIKFTPQGGRVDVTVRRVHSDMELSIADNGRGVAAKFLPFMFQRFRQADPSPTRREGGLGLGLGIVRQIVELHGGRVRAESPGIGRGTTMTIAIPILPVLMSGPEAPAEKASVYGDAVERERLDDVSILVVDDNEDGRELITTVLEAAGAKVTSVSSADEALGVLDRVHPDALISDIGLPGQDGYSLIRQLRLREAAHGGFLPALALTGYGRAEDRNRAIAEGFQAHLAKPADAAALTGAIAAFMSSRKARQ